jgi:hypothetical protein
MHVDGVGHAHRAKAPDMFEQGLARHHFAGMAHEIFEDFEFARQQLDRPAVAPNRLID